jgi:hypothetical protein
MINRKNDRGDGEQRPVGNRETRRQTQTSGGSALQRPATCIAVDDSCFLCNSSTLGRTGGTKLIGLFSKISGLYCDIYETND